MPRAARSSGARLPWDIDLLAGTSASVLLWTDGLPSYRSDGSWGSLEGR